MSFKAGSIPYTVVGTPEKDTGTRLVPPEELFQLMNDNPKIRDAIDRVERHDFKGKPSAAKMMVRKAASDDLAVRLRVQSQKKAIDLAKKKHEGKI